MKHAAAWGAGWLVACLTLSVAHAQDPGFKREQPRRVTKQLEGKAPPTLSVEGWINAPAEGLDWASLEGKVVLVDFWGTWCQPCVRSFPHLKDLQRKWADDLVIIGVHSTRGADQMASFVERAKLPWPVASDQRSRTEKAFRVDGFPDYFLIDRSGVLRFADLHKSDLDRALAYLIKEGRPAVPEEQLRAWQAARPELLFEDQESGARLELSFAFRESAAEEEGESRIVTTERWTDADGVQRTVTTESTFFQPLAPVRAEVVREAPDSPKLRIEATLGDRKFTGVRIEGKEETPLEIGLDSQTLSMSSFWLAGLVAPKSPGAKLKVQLADFVEGTLSIGIFTCEGPVMLTMGDEEVACVRYDLRRFGKPRATYWIDASGHVVRFETRGLKLDRR